MHEAPAALAVLSTVPQTLQQPTSATSKRSSYTTGAASETNALTRQGSTERPWMLRNQSAMSFLCPKRESETPKNYHAQGQDDPRRIEHTWGKRLSARQASTRQFRIPYVATSTVKPSAWPMHPLDCDGNGAIQYYECSCCRGMCIMFATCLIGNLRRPSLDTTS